MPLRSTRSDRSFPDACHPRFALRRAALTQSTIERRVLKAQAPASIRRVSTHREPPPHAPRMFRLDDRIALVTGGSRGIGRACCEAMAAQGATVIVNYVKGEAAANEVVGTAASDAAIESIVKRHGRLDILVANAGISIDALLLRLKDEDLQRLWATNLVGAVACARAASR